MTNRDDWHQVQQPAREALEHLRALTSSLRRLRNAAHKAEYPAVADEAYFLLGVLDRVGFGTVLAEMAEDR